MVYNTLSSKRRTPRSPPRVVVLRTNQFTTTLAFTDLLGGPAALSVFSPEPGGGESTDLIFTPQLVYLPVVKR